MGNVLSLSLAGSIAFPLSIGALIGVGLAPEVKGWYSTLRKPTWNPPNWIFGPVWSVFYTVMGVASWRVWKAGGGAVPLSLYGAQLLLNFIWSPIFFKAHNLKAACADITALLGILVATVYEFSKVDETSAYLMIPYIGWVSFAAALTYKITELNPDKRDKGGKSIPRALKEAGQKSTSEVTAAAANVFLAQSGETQSDAIGRKYD